MITINGVSVDAQGQTLEAYLSSTSYDPKRIAVERNGSIVPKSQYGQMILQEGDSIEIVSFVGGG